MFYRFKYFSGKGEDQIIFDAYVSYCDKNLTFIRELSRFLEKDHKLKLCLNERDLLVGSCKYDAIAEIISNRLVYINHNIFIFDYSYKHSMKRTVILSKLFYLWEVFFSRIRITI